MQQAWTGMYARRMAERLAIIRLEPRQLIDWWGWLGGGAPSFRWF